VARYTYINRDWQREDDIMQCGDCQRLVYSKFMNGHTTICGVDVEETGQKADRTGREEAKGNAQDQSATQGRSNNYAKH
jgi:hypothetical protein